MTPSKLGRYEIQSEIGHGAMGVVYKATDPVLDRTVAIKTINLSLDQSERAEYEARFYQEAQGRGRSQPSEHRHRLRRGRQRQCRLHGDGVPRRQRTA